MTQQSRATAIKFDGFEQLREVVPGTRREIVQVESGRLSGSILHATLGDLPIDAVSFNRSVRSRGAYPAGRVTIGIRGSLDARLPDSPISSGDIMLTPPGLERSNTYRGATSIIVTSLPLTEIEELYGDQKGLELLARGKFQTVKTSKRAFEFAMPRLVYLLNGLKRGSLCLSDDAVTFWRMAVIDMLAGDLISPDSHAGQFLASATRLVRSVEEFVDRKGARSVHIAEICLAMRVSRRTLHRAFEEVIGVGPISYLRYKRLCAIHDIICSGERRELTIQDLALEFGFLNPGRFAQYYRSHFGRLPVENRKLAGLS